MTLEILLIDFENVQPTRIGRLTPGNCKIWLFLGKTQNRAPVELVRALQPFGADVNYLTISGSGPDAAPDLGPESCAGCRLNSDPRGEPAAPCIDANLSSVRETCLPFMSQEITSSRK